eukprot:49827-Eustigmatos_ZCMA.PRE.1
MLRSWSTGPEAPVALAPSAARAVAVQAAGTAPPPPPIEPPSIPPLVASPSPRLPPPPALPQITMTIVSSASWLSSAPAQEPADVYVDHPLSTPHRLVLKPPQKKRLGGWERAKGKPTRPITTPHVSAAQPVRVSIPFPPKGTVPRRPLTNMGRRRARQHTPPVLRGPRPLHTQLSTRYPRLAHTSLPIRLHPYVNLTDITLL